MRPVAGLGIEMHPNHPVAAMRAMARPLILGYLEAAELTTWAYAYIGHDGDERCQPFVTIDDMYGVWDFDGTDRAELDQFVREEADALVAGEPSPGRYGLRWFGSPDVTVIPDVTD